MVNFLADPKQKNSASLPLKQSREKNCKNRIFSSLNSNDNNNLHFCLKTYKSKKQNYNLLLPNATYLLRASLAFTHCQI